MIQALEGQGQQQTKEKVSGQTVIVFTVMKRKLQLFGYKCHVDDSWLLKVLLGVMNGELPQGKPKRRWIDNIAEWCGCTLHKAS